MDETEHRASRSSAVRQDPEARRMQGSASEMQNPAMHRQRHGVWLRWWSPATAWPALMAGLRLERKCGRDVCFDPISGSLIQGDETAALALAEFPQALAPEGPTSRHRGRSVRRDGAEVLADRAACWYSSEAATSSAMTQPAARAGKEGVADLHLGRGAGRRTRDL